MAGKGLARSSRTIFRVFTPILAAMLVWMAVAESVLGALAMTAMCAVFVGPLFLLRYRLSRKRTVELEKLVASYDNGDAEEE